MSIHFVDHCTERLASKRMRVDKPVELLLARGHIVTTSDIANSKATFNIFQKNADPNYDGSMMDMLKGITTRVFDVSDDHFDNPQTSDYYRMMCSEADIVTVNSNNLMERVLKETGRDTLSTFLIKDPITFPHYNFSYSLNPKLVWYGHVTNIIPILETTEDLSNLTVYSNKNPVTKESKKYNFKQWEVGLVEEEIKDYDIVWIPLGKNKNNKNTNRAVDALMAGRFVITDSERVYGELKNFIFIGSFKEGIQFYKENKDLVKKMVLDGQDYVKHTYNDTVIADMWELALTGTVTRKITEIV